MKGGTIAGCWLVWLEFRVVDWCSLIACTSYVSTVTNGIWNTLDVNYAGMKPSSKKEQAAVELSHFSDIVMRRVKATIAWSSLISELSNTMSFHSFSDLKYA